MSWRFSFNRRSLSLPLFLLVATIISFAYLRGVAGVPFHPDESSYLFMSNEVKAVFQRPSSLFWQPVSLDGKRQTMRLLDPPLVHIVVEAGRRAAGLAPLPMDWNWQQTWEENQQAGVVPSPELLWAGRMAVAVLFPFSLLFFFLAVRASAGDFTAWAAALLLASNALVLLHTRRAEAEGILLFTLAFFLWSLVKTKKRPWLAAGTAALAFCAKQSLAPLALVGLIPILWRSEQGPRWSLRIQQALLYCGIYAAVIFLLSPFLWQQPFQAVLAAVRARQVLASAHAVHYASQTMPTIPDKVAGMVRQVYFAPPSFAEDPRYHAQTQTSEQAYLANPFHSLFRSTLGGWTLLLLSLAGMAVGGWQARHGLTRREGQCRRPAQYRVMLLLIATLLQIAALLVVVPLEWQRYYLPLVPFACLWAAYGLNQARIWILRKVQPRLAFSSSAASGRS